MTREDFSVLETQLSCPIGELEKLLQNKWTFPTGA
jgi:hypothetical protein